MSLAPGLQPAQSRSTANEARHDIHTENSTDGAGTIRTKLRSASDVFDDINSNDTGYNFGAGANVFFSDHFGLRADVRYFRELESLDDEDPITDNPFFDQEIATDVFNFWRGTIGITFRFGG